mgnify:FL=1
MLGYGAMIGAQDTDFVHSVREMARYSGKDTVVYQLYSNRDYPLQFSASIGSAAKIRRAWQSDIAAIDSAAAAAMFAANA